MLSNSKWENRQLSSVFVDQCEIELWATRESERKDEEVNVVPRILLPVCFPLNFFFKQKKEVQNCLLVLCFSSSVSPPPLQTATKLVISRLQTVAALTCSWHPTSSKTPRDAIIPSSESLLN